MNWDGKRRSHPNKSWEYNWLQDNHVYLLEHMTVSDDMISCLKRKNVLTLEDIQQIQRQRRTKDEVFALLKLLKKKEPIPYKSFLGALQETGQDKVRAHLKKCKNMRPNKGWDPACLTVNLLYLLDKLIVSDKMISILRKKDTLKSEDKKLIDSQKERRDKAFALVKSLELNGRESKALEAFLEAFLDALQETGQDSIHTHLKNNQKRPRQIQQKYRRKVPEENFLIDHLVYLQKNMEPKLLLILHLIQKEALNLGDEVEINKEKKTEDKVFVLIKLLLMKENRQKALDSFLGALSATDQGKIRDYITGSQSPKPPVQQKHSNNSQSPKPSVPQKKLNQRLDEKSLERTSELRQEEVDGPLLQHLIKEKVLDDKEVELIRDKQNKVSVTSLIKFVSRKGPKEFDAFIQALEKTDHYILAILKKYHVKPTSHGKDLGKNEQPKKNGDSGLHPSCLIDNLVYLQKKVDPEGYFLSHFIQEKVVSFEEADRHFSKATREDKVFAWVKILIRKGKDPQDTKPLETFFKALKETGQSYINDYLKENQSKNNPKQDENLSSYNFEKYCLKDNLVDFQKHVTLNGLLISHLIQDKVLNFNDEENIKKHGASPDQVEELIELLDKKGQRATEAFFNALKETNQDDICDKVRKQQEEKKEKETGKKTSFCIIM